MSDRKGISRMIRYVSCGCCILETECPTMLINYPEDDMNIWCNVSVFWEVSSESEERMIKQEIFGVCRKTGLWRCLGSQDMVKLRMDSRQSCELV